ncbi:proteasome assembly chaperone 2 [Galendromus occidentalis]|uniref:Proteasome assembly chaperone 2 n=1 Tax=Galendromus occidentalis TaxID=34638 RepID=A0AAJ6VZF3_9ACAR|nr:proteasome assembly chaperone 2 [Galendromus occidentalis]
MFVPLDKYRDQDWSDWTLIFPVVSIGNAAQLAIDLLCSSLDTELCGYMHSVSLLPLVGGNPYKDGDPRLATACQLYACSSKKILLIQQRTPVSPSCRGEYSSKLTSWMKSMNFRLVVMLATCLSQFRSPEQLKGSALQYLCGNAVDKSTSKDIENFGWKIFEKQDPLTKLPDPEGGVYLMPGSGMARPILEKSFQSDVPVVMMLLYCSEGDNTPDALLLADSLNKWLRLADKGWRTPMSWSHLFGQAAPKELY